MDCVELALWILIGIALSGFLIAATFACTFVYIQYKETNHEK